MLEWILDYKCVGSGESKGLKKKKIWHFTEVQGIMYYGLAATADLL